MPSVPVRARSEMRTMAHFSGPHLILVGVDGSAASLEALRWAAAEAELRHAEIVAVRSWRARRDWMAPYAGAARLPAPDREYEQARCALAADVAAVLGHAPRVPVRQELAVGEPARALLDRAAGADLLVLGGHRWDSAETDVIGPVRAACLRHAPCPVVFVAPSAGQDRARAKIWHHPQEGRTVSDPMALASAVGPGEGGARCHEGHQDGDERPPAIHGPRP
ncbi:universal stress protein [Actinomadura chokoriensis]|uniref:universal stress protein n=1 Tax=Actinomadura chokoriensis TaxID=454156 RepID=UPI003D15C1C9